MVVLWQMHGILIIAAAAWWNKNSRLQQRCISLVWLTLRGKVKIFRLCSVFFQLVSHFSNSKKFNKFSEYMLFIKLVINLGTTGVSIVLWRLMIFFWLRSTMSPSVLFSLKICCPLYHEGRRNYLHLPSSAIGELVL